MKGKLRLFEETGEMVRGLPILREVEIARERREHLFSVSDLMSSGKSLVCYVGPRFTVVQFLIRSPAGNEYVTEGISRRSIYDEQDADEGIFHATRRARAAMIKLLRNKHIHDKFAG